MIDQNRDGLIDVSDLKEMYSSLGMTISLSTETFKYMSHYL